MPTCEICGKEAREIAECKVCGVIFCGDCGDIEKQLCEDCLFSEEETAEDIWEEDEEDWDTFDEDEEDW